MEDVEKSGAYNETDCFNDILIEYRSLSSSIL